MITSSLEKNSSLWPSLFYYGSFIAMGIFFFSIFANFARWPTDVMWMWCLHIENDAYLTIISNNESRLCLRCLRLRWDGEAEMSITKSQRLYSRTWKSIEKWMQWNENGEKLKNAQVFSITFLIVFFSFAQLRFNFPNS